MLCPIDFYFRKLKNRGVYKKFFTIQKLDSCMCGMDIEMDGKDEMDVKMNGETVIEQPTQEAMNMAGGHKRVPLQIYMKH